jgi:hypothetical protein
MDDLTLLRNFHRDTPGPSPAETEAARARLLAAIDAPPPSARAAASWRLRGAARSLGRPRFWAPAAAAAAVTAVAVTAALLAAPGRPVTSSSSPAAVLLREAAAAAARQAPGTGHYYASVTEFLAGGQTRPMLLHTWIGPGDGGLQHSGNGILAGVPVMVGNRLLTWNQVQRLPTAPGPLLAYLARASAPLGSPEAQTEYESLVNLLLQAPTRPSFRSALFEVAARLPGVTLIPHAHDLIGRPAAAVYVPGGPRENPVTVLYFNPVTSAALGVANLPGLRLPCPPDFEQAVLASGYVNSPADLPPGTPAKPRPVKLPATSPDCPKPPTPQPPPSPSA